MIKLVQSRKDFSHIEGLDAAEKCPVSSPLTSIAGLVHVKLNATQPYDPDFGLSMSHLYAYSVYATKQLGYLVVISHDKVTENLTILDFGHLVASSQKDFFGGGGGI